MNGLKLIRTQCNISLNHLAEVLGVPRQRISVWETGKKEIPQEQLNQLSEYLGIGPEFLGEITDEQKEEILNTPVFPWGKGEKSYYLYRYEKPRPGILFKKERKYCLSEEYHKKKTAQKELVSQINQQIDGPSQNHMGDQLLFTKRGLEYYNYCLKNMELVYSKPVTRKMFYYHRLIEIMEAMTIAFDGDCNLPEESDDNYCFNEDPNFIKQLSVFIKTHMDPLLAELAEMESKSRKRK